MTRTGHGYGSDWHLLRYLGRHRETLDRLVARSCGGSDVEWLDYPFSDDPRWRDDRWRGLDFLPESNLARREWAKLWPRGGDAPTWDAVGRVKILGEEEWLLLDAKARLGELSGSCGTRGARNRRQIGSVFQVVKDDLGVPEDADWLEPYCEYCSRIALLHLLNTYGMASHLLFLYFTGDWEGSSRRRCPRTAAGWTRSIAKLERHVMLPREHALSGRMHSVFLDVAGREAAV